VHLVVSSMELGSVAELALKTLRIVRHHVQATTLGRTTIRKGGHDDMAAWAYRPRSFINVPAAIIRVDQEMEDRSVVPDVVSPLQRDPKHIRLQPLDSCVLVTQAMSRYREGASREIQDSKTVVAQLDKSINQRGGTTAHIDDAGRPARSYLRNQV